MIMPSHKQHIHVFGDGHKNIKDIFNIYVCSASHMVHWSPFPKCLVQALFMLGNCYTAIQILLKFVPNSLINKGPSTGSDND